MQPATNVERLGGLSPTQRELFELRLKDRKSGQSQRIVHAAGRQSYPLSFAQERLWFLEEWSGGNAAYNIALLLRLEGTLDISGLHRSLEAIVKRHEALRTGIRLENDPVQFIAPSVEFDLVVEHVAGEDEARARARREAQQPFDLRTLPLFRVRLLRLNEQEHWLTLTMHHAISDGWSIGIIVRELAAIYEGRVLPPLEIQYGDFAAWQRDEVQSGSLRHQLSYWIQQLAALPVLQLPTDKSRPRQVTYDGAGLNLSVSPSLAARLNDFSQREGITLYMALLAGFVALLHRYTGQQDIVVGSPIANRNFTQVEPLVGLFVNTLALRTEVGGEATFRELVQRVTQGTLAAYANQDVPFERLVQELHPQRDPSRNPLVQVMFQLQNMPWPTLRMGELFVSPVENESSVCRFDLEFHFREEPELSAWIQYNTGLFNAVTVRRLGDHLLQLLDAAISEPDTRIATLPLVAAPERALMLSEWNGVATEYPRDASLQQLFEAQVSATPEAVAAVFDGASITYRDLNARANQLAHYLQARGVGTGVNVGLCAERSLDMVIAVLGIIKAGGAYVPLDPSYPAERLDFMVEDTDARLLVTQEQFASRFACPTVCLDGDWSEIAKADTANPVQSSGPESLAYLIYTSGSTGRPKAVAVPHRAIARLVKNADYVQLGATDVVAQASNSAFDAITFELWGALLNGARLVGMRTDVMLSPERFARELVTHSVTTLFVTTALFNELATHAPEALRTLRHLLFGGEAVDVRRVAEFVRSGGPARLLHVYGPTETTTFATWYLVDGVAEGAATIPIGRPIANTRAYVLDAAAQLVPIGVAGELYIGGDGVALGYWRRPALTAERFVASPFDPAERLYRTGDLVRWNADGQLEFLGRLDHQVKIRGFRVEPGEIESVLGEHSAVEQSVVVVREGASGDRGMVAYVVAPKSSASELREYVRQRLPAYMLPSAFVMLADLPLNPNGKIDRAALPEPEITSDREFVPPRNNFEDQIAAIWSELLNVTSISVHDNFFDLGGHSLLAMRVMARIRRACGVDVPIRMLFEAPSIALLAEYIANVQPTDVSPLTEAVEHELPLSFAQERLWFVDQLLPNNAAYNMPLVLRLDGPLEAGRLRGCLNQVVARHESLRTRFVAVDRRPVQVITPSAELELPVTAVSSEHEAQQAAEDEVMQCFDLASAPLMRVRLLKLSDDEHWLVLTMHHAISDGWSIGVFVRDMAALYAGTHLDPLPIQYGDFAVWQRQWLQGPVLEEQLSYWRGQLKGAPVLQLPTDRPRPAVMSHRGAGHEIHVGSEVLLKLKALSREQGGTLYMTLLTAFVALVGRYSGQQDIVIGSPFANRNRGEIEPLIGLFVNTLVLRTDLSGEPSFRELLKRVREVTLGAFAHQDVPFDKLVQDLQPERDLSRNPLVQVQFQLQNLPLGSAEMADVKVSTVLGSSRVTRFDLEVHLAETDSGLSGIFQYSTDLWDASSMHRFGTHYVRLLEAAVADPNARLADLPLMSAAERAEVLGEWNATTTAYPRDESVAAVFEAQVAAAPEAVAVTFAGEGLSYGALNARANQLAHELRARGVGPDVPVGLCVERSLEMVVGLLGILKAGGAYVPLDPLYPAERLAFMVEDTQVRLVLTQARFRARFGEAGLCLDEDGARLAERSVANPAPLGGPEHLAYLIYTSGSTGQPKAVAVPQRAVVRLVKGTTYVELGAQDVFLQFAPLAFDASTFEIWGALLNGGRLVVFPPDTPSLEDLGRVVREQGVTTLWLTAGLFHQMIETAGESLRGLKQLLAGGDVLSAAHVRQALRKLPGCRLINGYGPTENTTFTCCHSFGSAEEVGTSVPIGRPIANTRVYVLDGVGAPVPVGVAGELYIGGDGLARGYWARPELTAERFVASGLDAGGRLYRTGDLVRWRPDGVLEFLGRRDGQVKIRGFRVEVGEIEALLSEHAAVQQVAVAARDADAGGKRLVAYVVAPGATVAALRDYVRARVPDYMVPSLFVFLDALPLTANGKVDRAALPAPDVVAERVIVPPSTMLEELIAQIWSDLLGVPCVNASDNFFDLGGHSLLATQLVSRIRQTVKVHLPLRSVFEHPTVTGCAREVESRLRQHATIEGPIPLVSRDVDMPLSFAQERLWFLQQLQPDSCAYHVPAAVRLRGALHIRALESAIETLVARHESLRSTFALVAEHPVQRVSPPAGFHLDVRDVSDLSPSQCDGLLHQLAVAPFDLAHGPLFRVTLLRLGALEHILLLNLHHIICDGWSLGVLFSELAATYAGHELPPVGVQYPDFAVWQRATADDTLMRNQIDYWRERLAGDLPTLQLPTINRVPAVQSLRGANKEFELSSDLSSALQALARDEGVTMFMVLLAGVSTLLHRYTDQTDVIVGSPVAGRTRSDIEGTVGLFVNSLVLRTDLSRDPTFRELLGQIRDVALEAYTHQDAPFERLVEELRPERRLSHSPLFQVMFTVQNLPFSGLHLPGILAESLALRPETAKFDLVFAFACQEGKVAVSVDYMIELFDAATITRMIGHLESLLASVVSNRDARVSRLAMLTIAEQRQVLVEWNATTVAPGSDRCVHELVEEQAALHPLRTAVVCGSETWTYQQLNRKANQLAHYLRSRGVQRDTPVVVCLERSADLILAVLAVLKAGGAYVPLDPAYPARRLQWLLTDASGAAVVTRSTWRQFAGGDALCLDTDWEQVARESEENPATGAAGNDLAYIVYTSGSTGEPKGVEVRHRGLMNLVAWHCREYDVVPEDRATQLASPAFDAMGWEIWPYLTAGASIHVVPEETRVHPSRLVAWMAEHGITLTFLPTPLAEAVLEEGVSDGLRLRALLTGGDRLHRAWTGLPFRLTNQYGPTESSVVTTWCEVGDEPGPPPIGKPISNTRVYVLDRNGQPVPIGVAGELHIGGEGLARGYWRRPELTAERFVSSDLDPARILYRTGDLVRWRGDGLLEFLGRIDQQVKIRGFRVELGEIETILGRHEGVVQTVAAVREDVPGQPRLVAYVVGDAREGDVRDYLRDRLPDYMVPSAFVFLPALPLTSNGKIDRDALPAPAAPTVIDHPVDELEKQIAGVWASVLRVDSVSRDDNFFDLGGHSLLLAHLHARLQKALAREFPLLDLFRNPTVRAFATSLNRGAEHTDANAVHARTELQKQSMERLRRARISAN